MIVLRVAFGFQNIATKLVMMLVRVMFSLFV